MNAIYEQLARHLDHLPGGFPATQSGVELRILQRLFTEEEAELALTLTPFPEPVSQIAQRTGLPESGLAPMLADMSRKGLIFRRKKDSGPQYMAAQFVIGIWEYHVNDLDEGLIRDFNEYIPYISDQWAKLNTKQLRVIPVSQSLSGQAEILPYEQAEHLIQAQKKIVVSPCICRKEHQMVGKGCDNPLEVCLSFGTAAGYYEDNGLGREVSTSEALEILKTGIEAGLVLQPGNAKRAVNICMCCGCCCQVLKNIKHQPKPAQAVNTNYYATIDSEDCIGCGICAQRCQMEAITVDDTATIDLDRCIGCGVCVMSCDAGAISLASKPEDMRWDPPETVVETYMNIAKERGLL